VSKRIGLPVTLKMRHDAHYVEQLTSYSGAAIGRMIPIEKVRPNPEQPRKALGDLRELTDSVREKGVLEPLLVRYVRGKTPTTSSPASAATTRRRPRACMSCRASRKLPTTRKRWSWL